MPPRGPRRRSHARPRPQRATAPRLLCHPWSKQRLAPHGCRRRQRAASPRRLGRPWSEQRRALRRPRSPRCPRRCPCSTKRSPSPLSPRLVYGAPLPSSLSESTLSPSLCPMQLSSLSPARSPSPLSRALALSLSSYGAIGAKWRKSCAVALRTVCGER